MEPTCAANMQTARIPWALTAASARKDTRAMASLVQVGSCWKQLCKRQSEKQGARRLSNHQFSSEGWVSYRQLGTEYIGYLKRHSCGMEICSRRN